VRCPKCGGELEADVVGGEIRRAPSSPFRSGPDHDLLDPRIREVDRCPSCGGVWLDRGEMARGLREAAAVDPQADYATPKSSPEVVADQTGFRCPRCAAEMQTIRSGAVPEVIYDLCPGCRGVWFDRGELARFARAGAPERALLLGEFP